MDRIRQALRPLKRLYGRHPAKGFGPIALKAVRQSAIDSDLARSTVNGIVIRIRRMYRWATENELIPADVLHGLQSVPGLRRGRCEVREADPILPVADSLVDATLQHVPPMVASLIRLQRLTGMRSCELVIMRGCDLDTSGKVWEYRPEHHKTEHHGHGKTICLGPRAQEIIRPMFKADLSAYLFSAADSEAQRRADQHRMRKTPISCGNRPGTNRKRRPKRSPRDHYDTASYRRAITRGCAKAFPPPGWPHR